MKKLKSSRSTKPKAKRKPQDYHKLAGVLPADIRKQGIEVQVYAYSGHRPIWAGVYYIPEINARAAFRLEKHWRRWRHWYDHLPANKARNYPAKEGPRAADALYIFPIHEPQAAKTYKIPLGA